MLFAEPLRVQRSTSSVFGHEKAVVQVKNGSPLESERKVWTLCTVLNDLRVRVVAFREGIQAGANNKSSATSFFTLECVNAEQLLAKTGVLYHFSVENVLGSGSSHRTQWPVLDGSKCEIAAELLTRMEESISQTESSHHPNAPWMKEKSFLKKNESWLAKLSLALHLPTIAILLRASSGTKPIQLLLLRPHVHAGNHSSVAYWASVVAVHEQCQHVALSPSGDAAIAVPAHFSTMEDPLKRCEASTSVLSGQIALLRGFERVPAVQSLHVLGGVVAEGSSGPRRMDRLLGSRLAFVQLREAAANTWNKGLVELIAGSHRGGIVISRPGRVEGAVQCGLCFRCARYTIGIPGRGDSWLLPPASTLSFAALKSGEAKEEDVLAPTPATASAHRVSYHVSRQRCVGSSNDHLVVLMSPESSVPAAVAPVLVSSGERSPRLSLTSPRVVLPASFTLHDTHAVFHPCVSGCLMVGVLANGPKEKKMPLQLYFLRWGAAELLPVHIASFRHWAELPSDFFSPLSALRILSAEVVKDSAGTPSLLVALGSTTSHHSIATLLVSLPHVEWWVQEVCQHARESCRVGGLGAGIAMSVAQSFSLMQQEQAWQRRQYCVSSAGLVTSKELHQYFGSEAESEDPRSSKGSLITEWMLLSAPQHPWIEGLAKSTMDAGQSESYFCTLLEECVGILRVELLTQQRNGGNLHPCLSCLCALFAGVQDGVDAIRLPSESSPLIEKERYLSFFRVLSNALLSALEVIALSHSASAILAAVSFLQGSEKKGGEHGAPGVVLEWWHKLLEPVFDSAYRWLASAATLASRLLPHCSEGFRRSATCSKSLLHNSGNRAASPLLLPCNEASSIEPLKETLKDASSAEILSAARRLFLSNSADAAVKLLQAVSLTHPAAAELQRDCDMFAALQKRTQKYGASFSMAAKLS